MPKRLFIRYLTFLLVLLELVMFAAPDNIQVYAENSGLKPYDDVRGKDISSYDFRDKEELVYTLTFSNATVWPSKDKLPNGFDPGKVMEFGKEPGLGIKKLHDMGYTGKGVNIAYIDQPLLAGHEAYSGLKLVYNKIRPEVPYMNSSMHGPSVLSLLAGKEIGVAPESGVYFFGHPAWLQDQTTHAAALRKLIEINKTLPAGQKVRIVGFSDSVDPSEKNADEFGKAVVEAENSGIMVFDVTTMNVVPLFVKPFKDKNDPNNYEAAQWAKDFPIESNSLCVPSSGRTTATGNPESVKAYDYWTNGGLSWTIPYIVGTAALGLQIDPTLTKEDIIKFLHLSSYPFKNGSGIINPEGFVRLVEASKAAKHKENSDYYYILYNSKKVNDADMAAIRIYTAQMGNDRDVILKDVSQYSDAAQVYELLKSDAQNRKGKPAGIQIFGIPEDVPAFDVHFKIQMQSSIDDSGDFKSDFFYSTFKNDGAILNTDFSIYKAFADKLDVSFIPEWPVSRLPLTKGEIAGFLKRYGEYVSQLQKQSPVPLVNFSNPIFASPVHTDDMGYFIKERLDKEFHILDSSDYRLYGNKKGSYPVTTNVIGDFTKDNVKAENEKEIINLFINTHGQENNIDQTVFEYPSSKSEKRISFLNSKDINDILAKNYYILSTWTCLNAWGLGRNNLVHEAMANGKCIEALAASSIISNNGVDNRVSPDEMKKNNFYYFQYAFFNNLYKSGRTRSESFYLAKKAYAEEILKNTSKLGEGNYQFNLHNVLTYHYLGLLEYSPDRNQILLEAMKALRTDNVPKIADQVVSGSYITDEENYDDVKFDFNIGFTTRIASGDLSITGLKAGRKGSDVVFSLDYKSGTQRVFSFFNPPNGDRIMIVNRNGLVPDKNNVKFKVPAAVLNDLSFITMRFFKNGADEENFIFLDVSQLKKVLS